jgi:hypothetical protein
MGRVRRQRASGDIPRRQQRPLAAPGEHESNLSSVQSPFDRIIQVADAGGIGVGLLPVIGVDRPRDRRARFDAHDPILTSTVHCSSRDNFDLRLERGAIFLSPAKLAHGCRAVQRVSPSVAALPRCSWTLPQLNTRKLMQRSSRDA